MSATSARNASSVANRKNASIVTTAKSSRTSRESKFAVQKNRKFNGSAGNVSLARTSSTYSIDSVVSSKKKVERPLIMTAATRSTAYYPVSVSKVRKIKKSVSREHLDQKKVRPDSKVAQKEVAKRPTEAKHNSRSDSFFQKLFLRDMTPPPPLLPSSTNKTLVQEKAEVWDNLSVNPIETVQKSTANIYLTQKRPVTDSKFKTMDDQSEHSRQSRSLSPRAYRKSGGDFLWFNQSSSVFLSSDNEEFGGGGSSGSNAADGRGKICFTEVHEPNTPIVIHGTLSTTTTTQFRSESPQTLRPTRSPACRRIQSLRANHKSDSIRAPPARARSLGSAADRNALEQPIQSRSCYSLDVNNYENHNRLCSHQKSERFRQLEQFYNNLERVGQLEKATSSTDLRPIRKEGEIIDFDEWQQMRSHEKAEKELNQLVGKIRVDEKANDLLFRPKYHEDHKWNERQDSGLRTREKSVEDLKEILMEKSLYEDVGSELKLQQDAMAKGQYKSFWRGKSVTDAATHMVGKYNPGVMTLPSPQDRRFGLSKKLISTLSRDQVNKLKNQLSEIYSNNFGGAAGKDDASCHIEVRAGDGGGGGTAGLTVRSNSLVFKEELLGQVKLRESYKADSIGSIHEPRVSRSVDRYEDIIRKEQKLLSESDKKSILQNLSKELQDKFQQRRNQSLVVLGKEVRGAIASNIARNTLPKVDKKTRPKAETKEIVIKTPAANDSAQNSLVFIDADTKLESSGNKKIVNQIEYFEKKRDELPETTIYQAYSSPDEEEIMKVIDQKMRNKKATVNTSAAAAAEKRNRSPTFGQHGLSSSVSDFKEIFGETSHQTVKRAASPSKMRSNTTSVESVFRSRSVSPLYYYGKPKFLLNAPVRTGDVQKIKDKFESLNYHQADETDPVPSMRRFQSDPELTKRHQSPSKIAVSELGDVSWITHKFETKNCASAGRGRCRQRKVCSPIPPKAPLTLTDLRMPHIDIISKTASLRLQMRKNKSPASSITSSRCSGADVKRIKSKFEKSDCSLLGQMYTSSPDISQLRDISSYLTGPWTAHKYPNRKDNSLSPVQQQSGATGEVVVKRRNVRPSSASPPRNRIATILKPFYRMNGADGDGDEGEVKKKRRAQDKRTQADVLYRKLQSRIVPRKPTVKFEGFYAIFF